MVSMGVLGGTRASKKIEKAWLSPRISRLSSMVGSRGRGVFVLVSMLDRKSTPRIRLPCSSWAYWSTAKKASILRAVPPPIWNRTAAEELGLYRASATVLAISRDAPVTPPLLQGMIVELMGPVLASWPLGYTARVKTWSRMKLSGNLLM